MSDAAPPSSRRGGSRVSDAAAAATTSDERTPLLPTSAASPHTSLSDDVEARWRRWTDKVSKLASPRHAAHRAAKEAQAAKPPRVLVSVFEPEEGDPPADLGSIEYSCITEGELQSQVEEVRTAIRHGLYPKMITTGSSGSYFARAPARYDESGKPVRGVLKTLAVFKPMDEEPYGNLNPKRVFLRKYLWWAMGRPCLIPNFSAFSEVGASYLDAQLRLGLVPRTALVSLSSPSFHYHYADRRAYEVEGRPLPEKIGSWQTFLPGYLNASDFLRAHPWPSRPRSLLERDLAAEQRAHRSSRKKQGKKLRTCLVATKHLLLCRQGYELEDEPGTPVQREVGEAQRAVIDAPAGQDDEFHWTQECMQSFRLELEKLVCLDYLQRNTDRGLDNFMLRPYVDAEGHQRMALGAIDNSLAFPHKHPVGIRSYPMGWLYLPVDLIGGPFSAQTRAHFIPLLSDAAWWRETTLGLRRIFERDEHFDAKLFERQMSVMRGQGWNLLQSLRNPQEGPLELCARQKHVVHQDVVLLTEPELASEPGVHLILPASQGAGEPASASKPIRIAPSSPRMTPVRAKPMTMHSRHANSSGGDLAGIATSLPLGAHPRSLPETVEGVAAAWKRAAPTEDAAPLGIDVVAQFDKAARKARRPTFRKALTGALGSSPGTPRAQVHRTISSATTQPDEHDTTLDESATRSPSAAAPRTRSPPPALSRAARSETNVLTGAAASIQATLENARQAEEELMTASVPALPARAGVASSPTASRPGRGRRRMGSVGGWSLSAFERRASSVGPDAERGEVQAVPSKVIVEHIESDDGVAWQTWLGL